MPTPESKNLIIQENKNSSIKKMELDPRHFSIYALRVIARNQIRDPHLIDITILKNPEGVLSQSQGGITCIGREHIDIINRLRKRDRHLAFKGIARMMCFADKVIIRRTSF